MTYLEKLKDPRWQKKRLRVLEKAGWQCEECFDDLKTLHVHHKKYYKNPWDAPYKDLQVLCETCHYYEFLIDKDIKEEDNHGDMGGYDLEDLSECCRLIWNVCLDAFNDNNKPEEFSGSTLIIKILDKCEIEITEK